MLRENNEYKLLVTFYVVILYINIPHTLRMETLNYWLEKYQQGLHARFKVHARFKGAKIIFVSATKIDKNGF